MRRTIIHALQSTILGQLVSGDSEEEEETSNVPPPPPPPPVLATANGDEPIVKRLRSGNHNTSRQQQQEEVPDDGPVILEMPDIDIPIQVRKQHHQEHNIEMFGINKLTQERGIQVQVENGINKDDIKRDIQQYSYNNDNNNKNDNKDPLDDEAYEIIHKKFEKREISAKIRERENTAFEIHRQSIQLNGLNSNDWIKYIPQQQSVDDDGNLKLIRNGLIKEIELNLFKYNQYKYKERHQQDGAAAARQVDNDNDDVYLYVLQKYQDIPNVTPIKAAITSPTKRQKKNKNIHLQTKPFKSFFISPSKRDMFVKKINRIGIRRKLYAFGVEIPDIPYRVFDIPNEWKNSLQKKI